MGLDYDRVAAPSWFAIFVQLLDRTFSGLSSTPTLIVANAAALPDVLSWMGRQAYVTSINRVVISTGTNWIRTDTGAAV